MTSEQQQKLRQLDQLLGNGTLSPEEYQSARSRILSSPASAQLVTSPPISTQPQQPPPTQQAAGKSTSSTQIRNLFFAALIVIGVIVLFNIWFGPSSSPSTEASSTDALMSADSAAAAAPEKVTLTDRLNKELKSVTAEKFGTSAFRGSVDNLKMEAALFVVWGKLVAEGKASSKKGDAALAKKLERRVATIQMAQFPLMRREYTRIVKEKLWEENIEVSATGKSNTILQLTGGTFASNKNIKTAQDAIYEILQMLRFKQTRYRWYKGADEYTYYAVESPGDGKVLSDL